MARKSEGGLLGGKRIKLPEHKAFVECDDALWREFRAQLVAEGRLVQVELGELVARRVAGAKRKATARGKRTRARSAERRGAVG
jgi:hypothetical protein